MTLLVHLTAAKNIRAVRRTGIRAAGHGQGGGAGVYCLPVLPSYQITYQWVRELRRGGQGTLVAVHFRVPDDEPVWVGHYNSAPVQLSCARPPPWWPSRRTLAGANCSSPGRSRPGRSTASGGSTR